MRRISTLLLAAGLAAAPASAVAGPSPTPSPSRTVEHFEWSTSRGRLGVMVTSLTPELRRHFGAREDRGVLVARVEPATPAAAAGIEVGDVIVEVRGKRIDAAPDVLEALAGVDAGQKVPVTLVRDGTPRTVDATLTNDASAFAPAFTSPFGEGWFRRWFETLPMPGDDRS